jgi:hypothetical protein
MTPSGSKTPSEETACRWAWGLRRFPNDCGATIIAGIGFFIGRKVRREKLACRGVRDFCELAVECALEEKVLAEQLRDRENHLPVRNVRQDFRDHALGPGNGAFLPANSDRD